MSMISATGQVGNSQYLPGYIAIAITGEHRKHGDTAAASRGAMQSQADGIFQKVSTTGLQKKLMDSVRAMKSQLQIPLGNNYPEACYN